MGPETIISSTYIHWTNTVMTEEYKKSSERNSDKNFFI